MEEKTPRPYKIMIGDKVKIWRKDYNTSIFYSIMVQQKQQNGTMKKFYQKASFLKGVEIENGTIIRLLNFYENWRENQKDLYNPIRELKITNYEIVEKEVTSEEIIGNYANNLGNPQESDPSNYVLDEDSLPF